MSSDITKCFNGCEKKLLCHRWTAKSKEFQSVADFKPNDNGVCTYYWPNAVAKTVVRPELINHNED